MLTFFSLISDGLGGVIGMMPMVMVLLATVANYDLLKVPENNGAFGDSPFRGQSHRQRLQPFMTVAAPSVTVANDDLFKVPQNNP